MSIAIQEPAQRAFSELFEELDTTTATNLKVAAMVRYFKTADAADAAWAAYILSGRRLKRFIGPTLVDRVVALPEWLIDESLAAVGDMAETIALLMESAGREGSAPTSRSLSGSTAGYCRCAKSRSKSNTRRLSLGGAPCPTGSAFCSISS